MTALSAITLDETVLRNYTAVVRADCHTILSEIQRDAAVILQSGTPPPYQLFITLSETTMMLQFTNAVGTSPERFHIRISALRGIMQDYDLMIGAHGSALRHQMPHSRTEAIDMGRRAMHNEGAEMILQQLAPDLTADLGTARLLFTLLFILTQRR